LLSGSPDFVVPELDRGFTTSRVLAMSFVESRPIEVLDDAPQEQRDDAMRRIVTLVLRELFEFGVMQTDPNFANYRLLDDGRIVLLDFGAAQDVPEAIREGYRTLMAAALAGDAETVKRGAVAAGFIGQAVAEHHGDALERMVQIVLTELNRDGPFDFGDRAFLLTLREEGIKIAADKASWHLPPADLLFVQRKVSGTALLGARLKARVDVHGLVAEALG
jgi:predicted unusual protein kinase regulating ubiquinone biosynthesis (AarF/ABC1/UbiB family)